MNTMATTMLTHGSDRAAAEAIAAAADYWRWWFSLIGIYAGFDTWQQ